MNTKVLNNETRGNPMLLDINKMALIAQAPPLPGKQYWRPSSVAMREAKDYQSIPENLSNNAKLVEAVEGKDTTKIVVESLECLKQPFGPEHDEAIVIAFAMQNGLLTEVLKDNKDETIL